MMAGADKEECRQCRLQGQAELVQGSLAFGKIVIKLFLKEEEFFVGHAMVRPNSYLKIAGGLHYFLEKQRTKLSLEFWSIKSGVDIRSA